MSRTSTDEVDAQGIVKNGFDYNLQVWVKDWIVQDCGHPDPMKRGKYSCCEAHRLAGQDIRSIPGAERRIE